MKLFAFSIFVILVVNLAFITADTFYGPKDCKVDAVKGTPEFKLCQAIENNTKVDPENANPAEMYCKGLKQATECFVETFVENCDMYAAREYVQSRLPKDDIDMTGVECQNFTRYLKEIGIDKECDEKINNNPDLVRCRKEIEDAFLVAEQAVVSSGKQEQFSTVFCNHSHSGLVCLHEGYNKSCGEELASAHVKDYAEVPDQLDLDNPQCLALKQFMLRNGVSPTQVPAPSHAVPNPSSMSTPGNNGTSNDTTPGIPGNASSPVPINTTEHNGAALAEIFSLEKLVVAVIALLYSYAATKH
ncbi:hypothetical protein Ddc_11189 [Ditylenchus destructor]|nr:hypothetical protein Ddc_11189 [Ditylenchus destructor]